MVCTKSRSLVGCMTMHCTLPPCTKPYAAYCDHIPIVIIYAPSSWSHTSCNSTSSLSGTPGSSGMVQVMSGTMWCQLLGRMVAVEQLQGRQSPGLCPFANRGLTGSWNDCLTTAATGFHAVVEHSPWNL